MENESFAETTNMSVLKETYVLAPGKQIHPNPLKKKDGAYRLELTSDNDVNKTYITNLDSGEPDAIYITGDPDEPFIVEVAEG